ncbi:hypothetical protein [Comamonas antarctica]|uniref:hypothetical protein n=1 Tax=Comamonas antarctica TaxID=2743470 RepID=UPI0028E40983|nr:hypothetical protein [Comamonas antarctica]
MTVIHAFRRKESTTVELFGLSIEFKPNEKKDVVADVDHDGAVDRLLSISEAYRLYADQPLALSRHDQASMRLIDALDARIRVDQHGFVAGIQSAISAVPTAPAAPVPAPAPAPAPEAVELDTAPDAQQQDVPANGQNTDATGAGAGGADQDAAKDQPEGDTGGEASPYVFANDAGDSIDISKWTAKEIRDFAEQNQIELPKGNSVKVGELRDLLAAALAAGAEE